MLAADTYTATLLSSSTAFNDLFGSLLDGDSNFVAGGDYTNSFVVAPSAARVVSIRDFARGPGQNVDDTPATPGSKLAVQLDVASGVTALDFDVHYDSTLLTISSAALASGLPSGWSITVNPISLGVFKVTASGTTALSGMNVPVVLLDANVPATAPYGDSEVIRLVNVRVNEDLIPSVGDYAVHKDVYLGDADGDGLYLGFDAALISRVVVNLDTGFDAHSWTDPLIVADATGDGTLSGLDASYVAQKGIALPRPEIPDLPGILLAAGSPGVDPELSIPSSIPAAPGGSVTVPVNINIPLAEDVYSATFRVDYDSAVLAFNAAANGALWSVGGGWTLLVNDTVAGEVAVTLYNSTPSPTGTGTIADLDFNVLPTAAGGESPLDVVKIGETEGGLSWTDVDGSVDVVTDTTPPTVSQVLFGSTGWSSLFTNYLVANSLGTADGYAIPDGALQTKTLPWTNLNKISVVFSEDVNVSAGSLELYGVNVASYSLPTFSYNASTFTATWTLASALGTDKLLLHLLDSVTDQAGNALDGDWTNPPTGDSYPSGNNFAGGDFDFRVNVVPGDTSGNTGVSPADATLVAQRFGATTVSGPYDIRMDVNGNGGIVPADATLVAQRFGQVLPGGEPVVPAMMLSEPLVASAVVDENSTDGIFAAIRIGSRSTNTGQTPFAPQVMPAAETSARVREGIFSKFGVQMHDANRMIPGLIAMPRMPWKIGRWTTN